MEKFCKKQDIPDVQLMPLSIVKAEVKNEQMDNSSQIPSQIVHMTDTIVKREMKTDRIDYIFQSSITTISPQIQFRERGLKRETTDVCQSSYMKQKTRSQAKENRIKPEVNVSAASYDTQHDIIKEEKIHMKNETTSKLSMQLFGLIAPFGTAIKMNKESTTSQDHVTYKQNVQLRTNQSAVNLSTSLILCTLRKNLVNSHSHVMNVSLNL